ncbi:hypothetical protein [Paraburkholderia caballeronis]|uniref:hypothetical protein n=1 Tax=Paraburkholderia caballeronis TaxID=416943 RepID=UPI001065B65D|nr:hypothetical protein [Paraburkholderia caballeronis]TDV06056.1 hypothetical protein C7408_12437 [Paraburkholderia caballeronis]TDV09596.1 hypothetical protein C7406_12637 [Paraburkholderia caballeronis]TDV21661.1 hypothetical protein C7404_12137 [Paraburkholderia caballeronis]
MKYTEDVLLRRPCHLALCLDETSYLREMRRLKIASPSAFVIDGKSATMHWFDGKEGKDDLAIVCVDMHRLRECTGTQIAAVLVHEAVHVWQGVCEVMGEESPSREFEAYSIQRISQDLMWLFTELTGKV